MKKDPRLYKEATVSEPANSCRQALEVGARWVSFARLQLPKARKLFTNCLRITAAVQNSPYSFQRAFLIVIDGVGETLGQQPIVPKHLAWIPA